MTTYELKVLQLEKLDLLIDALSNSYEEIRYMKQRQFTTAHYTVLLYAGIIALFQIKVRIPSPFLEIFGVLAIVAITILGCFSVRFQIDHNNSLRDYREGLPEMKTKNEEEKNKIRKDQEAQAQRYTGFLIAMTIIAAIAAGIVILFKTLVAKC